MSSSMWRAKPSARATSRAASSSTACTWPYRIVKPYKAKPSRRASADAVAESRPPESRTTARRSRAGGDVSDTARLRCPDVLVELELQAHRQGRVQDPARQLLRIQDAMRWRKQHGRDAIHEVMPGHDVVCVVEVRAIRDHELHFVVRAQRVEIRPVHAAGLATPRTLHVDDLPDRVRHGIERDVPAGFEQDLVALVEQTLHQRAGVLLQQRLAAGQLDEP